MKAVAGFLACIMCFWVFPGKAATIPPLDTTNISPNILDFAKCSTDVFAGSIDTTGGLFQSDSGLRVVRFSVNKRAWFDSVVSGMSEAYFPYTSLILKLDTSFRGATAVRITYKSDKRWWVSLVDTTNDQASYSFYGQTIPYAPVWQTVYANLLDASSVNGFSRIWSDANTTPPLNLNVTIGLQFDPYTFNDEAVISIIEISDVRIFNYQGIKHFSLVSPANNAVNQPLFPALCWNKIDNASTYHVQIAADSTFSNNLIVDAAVAANSMLVGPLSEGKTYYWRVIADNGGSIFDQSSIWKFTTIATTASQNMKRSSKRYSMFLSAASSGRTVLRFEIPKASSVVLAVYNCQGAILESMHKSYEQPGNYELPLASQRIPQGYYILQFSAGPYSTMKRIALY